MLVNEERMPMSLDFLSNFEWPARETLYPYVFSLLRAGVVIFLAFVASALAAKLFARFRQRIVHIMTRNAGDQAEAVEKRAQTVGGLLQKTAVTVIWTVAVIMSLKEVGFDVGPLLAGAGVAGLAIGFGAQNLVRDVITGLFILLENQIRVNDVAIINGTGGLVEEINLRTTVLRGLDGVVHIFPNGTIDELANMTRKFSYYVFDMGVAYKEDTDQVAEIMREIAEEMRQDPEYAPMILEPLEVLGVDQFADSAVVLKARIKTRPIKQWAVGREMNRRIKKKFDEVGIEIPFPHRSIYFGEASQPIGLKIDGAGREELKQVVREVLREAA
jgi:small conductance mechanosensitive channel